MSGSSNKEKVVPLNLERWVKSPSKDFWRTGDFWVGAAMGFLFGPLFLIWSIAS